MLTKNEWNVVQCLEDTKVLDMIYIFKKIFQNIFFLITKKVQCVTPWTKDFQVLVMEMRIKT